MKGEKTRITIRIEKDLLAEFRKIFPYRGELTAFILRCMKEVCSADVVDVVVLKRQIVGGR